MRSNEETALEVEAMGVIPQFGHDSQLLHNEVDNGNLPFPSIHAGQREGWEVEAERTMPYTYIGPRTLNIHPYCPMQDYVVNGREQVEACQGAALSRTPISMVEAYLSTYKQFDQESGDPFSVFPQADSWAGHASWPRWSDLPNV